MDYIAERTDFNYKNSVITIGKFDGLHMGHQYLFNQVVTYKELGYKAVMFTFFFHPSTVLTNKEIELIYTEEEKISKLKRLGMDVLISYPFTAETRNMEPEDFIRDILVGKLDMKILVVGVDFRFGKNRRGDIELLKKYEDTYGYKVIACEKQTWNDTIISSTDIRAHITEGNMEDANKMLGQPFFVRGEVKHGRKIGRTLGIPTTNIIPPSNKLLPPNGVYASKTRIGEEIYYSVTNIGFNPTVGGDSTKKVETYIFDYNADLYGKDIEVELYHYERPELKFEQLEDMRQQMACDIKVTKEYFNIV